MPERSNSPFIRTQASVTRVMGDVLLALVPGVAAYVWQFGIGILVQMALATVTAVLCEAAMLRARGKPPARHLGDLSVVVTAWLTALAFPPLAPWWLVVTGTALAVVVAKHLYGGLGQNPFNPAMVAYCAMIVAFPALMSQWPAPHVDTAAQWQAIFGGEALRTIDAITSATPLDALRTGLRDASSHANDIVRGEAFGHLGGKGWEWIAAGYLLGGAWLLYRRVITWHIPTAYLAVLAALAGLLWLANDARFASPLLHVASGGAMLGAFFILTDPVSGATTPRGKLIFAAGAALLTYVIRVWGAYPDGVAFATLLMNICAPLIDLKTQPPVFGHKPGKQERRS
ncbi:MAG: RnfABCDGE type electron transport complex subunit D [Rhodocyclaceae bacterium]